jgi:hypothetical protein
VISQDLPFSVPDRKFALRPGSGGEGSDTRMTTQKVYLRVLLPIILYVYTSVMAACQTTGFRLAVELESYLRGNAMTRGSQVSSGTPWNSGDGVVEDRNRTLGEWSATLP